MRGDDNPFEWQYAVGVMTLHKGGFPGPVTDSRRNNYKIVNQSVLYVLKDCKPTTTTTTTTTSSTSGTLDKTPVGTGCAMDFSRAFLFSSYIDR
jgi:hypothetical protein